MWEILFKIGLTIGVTTVLFIPYAFGVRWIWTHQLDPEETVSRIFQSAGERDWIATRDPMKLYQGGQPVADITGAISDDGSRVVFKQLANAGALNTSEPVEWRRLRLRVVRVGSAGGQSVSVGATGSRVLTNVRGDVECEVIP